MSTPGKRRTNQPGLQEADSDHLRHAQVCLLSTHAAPFTNEAAWSGNVCYKDKVSAYLADYAHGVPS